MEVKFGFTFDEAPHVVVQLAAVDASKGKGRRFETWASDESCEGFRLHARTWEDSVTWTLKVSWLATSEPVVQVGVLSIGKWPDCRVSEKETRSVSFRRLFTCAPDIVLGIAGIDANGSENLRLATGSSAVRSRGFELACATPAPSVTWNTKVSWIACSSPAVLQCGSVDLCSSTTDPIHDGEDRSVVVRFQRPFNSIPNVALSIAGIDADGSAHTRVNTWIDDASEEGFRLHATSWETSRLWTLRVSWVATPVEQSVNSSSSVVPPHYPPLEYIVDGPPLGTGWWGVTHRAKHIDSGETYAVKTCRHPFQQHEQILRKELDSLSRLPEHVNLLRYHGCVLQADRLHIITEYINAFNLTDLVPAPDGKYGSRHPTQTILRWMTQLYDGLAHMHQVGIVHRDLHGQNVLVEKDVRGEPSLSHRAVRIIDFGASKVYEAMKPQVMSHKAGCWQYFSPERRKGDVFDDRDDVWAGGCQLVELVSGNMISQRVGCGVGGIDFATLPEQTAAVLADCGTGRCRDLATAILNRDAEMRPRAAAVRDTIRGMVTYSPGKRAAFAGGSFHGEHPSRVAFTRWARAGC